MGDEPKQKSEEVTANDNNSVNSSKLDRQPVSSVDFVSDWFKSGGRIVSEY